MVEGTRSIRQAEVGSVRKTLDRIKDRYDVDPERLNASSQTAPVDQGRYWDCSLIVTSNLTYQSWTKQAGLVAHGAALTSNGIRGTTSAYAHRANRSSSSDAIIPIRTVVHQATMSPSIAD